MARATDGEDRAGSAHPNEHPDLARVAGEMRAAWREEQDAAAADAAAHWRHTRGLADWLCDRMHAGDLIAAAVMGQRFVGRVEEVGRDLAALRCESRRVEIHVDAAIPVSFEVVEHATHGGARSMVRREFRDALVARDAQAPVTVATLQHPFGIEGALFVGRDFVTVASSSGTETVVPVAQIAWVAAARA